MSKAHHLGYLAPDDNLKAYPLVVLEAKLERARMELTLITDYPHSVDPIFMKNVDYFKNEVARLERAISRKRFWNWFSNFWS